MYPLKSALFVDFDNIFIRLQQQDEQLALNFATQPEQWLKWLENNVLIRHREQQHRELLVRKCYLNPNSFSQYRPFFIKTAFNVIDCPSLTTHGKNSADIHMVLDILDTLDKAEPCYDEFIIFSGDADFTPVLIRLRERGRLTTVLSVGAASAAYKSAASSLISEEQFIDETLVTGQGDSGVDGIGVEKIRKSIAKNVVEAVTKSPVPMTFASIGGLIRRQYPDQVGDDWFGEGRLKDFLATLDLEGMQVDYASPGYLYDPSRHARPGDGRPNPFKKAHPEIYELASRIHHLTDMPLLSPETYRAMFLELEKEVAENGYQLTQTSKRLRDRCVEGGNIIGRQHANFVLRGLQRVNYRFKADGTDSAAEMAKALAENVHNMCLSAQLRLSQEEMGLLFRWLLHGVCGS